MTMTDDEVIDVPGLPATFRFSAARARRLDRRLEDVERNDILDVFRANGIDRKTRPDRIAMYRVRP